MQLFKIYINLLCFWTSGNNAAKILALFPFFSKSHFNFNTAIMKCLHAAGHQVTVVHSFPGESEIDNYTAIDASRADKPSNTNFISILEIQSNVNTLSLYDSLLNDSEKDCNHVINLKEIQRILHSNEPLFDLVFLDVAVFLYECYLPLVQKMNVPVIATVSTRSWRKIEWILGNPYPPASVPFEVGSYRSDRMSFVQRLTNTFDCIFDFFYHRLRISPRVHQFYQQHFPNHTSRSEIRPSLLFVNGHQVLLPRPSLPNIIYVGGIHLAPANVIPPELQTFVDEAEHGIILFSIGSIFRNDKRSLPLLLPFIEAFSQIPQRVIWKTDEKLENLSDNILQLEWLPQRDLLVQEKVLAFVTHGGNGGIFEAIDAVKPLIMVPIDFDQISNVALLERLGVGIYIDIWSTTTSKLLNALNLVVNDTRYRDRMQEISQIFGDRPMSLQKTVVYWTEYVIKYNGTTHLESVAATMPLYQYLLLDVIFFLTIIMTAVTCGGYYFVKKMYTLICVSKKLKPVEYPRKYN